MQIKVMIFVKNIIRVSIMHEIDLKNYNVRSDLVVDFIQDDYKKGMDYKEESYDKVSVLDIALKKDNDLLKKEGRYITISFEDVTDTFNRKNIQSVLVKKLKELLKDKKLLGKKCLVVGLGNISSTPDSLGPKVASEVLVTRYLFELENTEVEKGYSCVSSIIPGVIGTTGIESSDIVLGIVEKIKPDFIIAIDALASSSIDRINKTIQITDTGIHPGSGVGNRRKELSETTLNIPVIAIGVPTVIDGVTIVSDTIKYMLKQFSYNKESSTKNSNKLVPITNKNYLEHDKELTPIEKKEVLGLVGNLTDEEIKSLIFEVLTPIGYNLMVTVKEVDFITENLTKVLVYGINHSLHENILEN